MKVRYDVRLYDKVNWGKVRIMKVRFEIIRYTVIMLNGHPSYTLHTAGLGLDPNNEKIKKYKNKKKKKK